MFERFTQPAREAVVGAQTQARKLQHTEIRAEHLLLALLDDHDGVAARVLHRLGVDDRAVLEQVQSLASPDREALRGIGIDLDEVRRRAEQTFGPGALDRPRRQRRGRFGHRCDDGGHLPFTREAKSALELALRESLARKDGYIGAEHLLLGLLATGPGSVQRLLDAAGAGVDMGQVRIAIDEELRRTA